MRSALGCGVVDDVKRVAWLNDRQSGLFYGSAFVEFTTVEAAQRAVLAAASTSEGGGIKVKGRTLRLNFAPVREGEVWPSSAWQESERPSNSILV